MEFQLDQVFYFMALGGIFFIAYISNIVWVKWVALAIIVIAFLINPFRMTVPTAVQSFEGSQRITKLPPKVEGKQYQPFDNWTQSEKDKLKQQNEDNSNEIHN